jgi:hypothetical protein
MRPSFVTSGEVIPSADWSPVDHMRIQSFFIMLVRVDLGGLFKRAHFTRNRDNRLLCDASR